MCPHSFIDARYSRAFVIVEKSRKFAPPPWHESRRRTPQGEKVIPQNLPQNEAKLHDLRGKGRTKHETRQHHGNQHEYWRFALFLHVAEGFWRERGRFCHGRGREFESRRPRHFFFNSSRPVAWWPCATLALLVYILSLNPRNSAYAAVRYGRYGLQNPAPILHVFMVALTHE